MTTPQYKLLIVRFPGNAQEHPDSSTYVVNLLRHIAQGNHPEISKAEHIWINDTPITMSRNRAVKFALHHEYDYLLMIDSDMKPDLYREPGRPAGAPRFFDVAWAFMMHRRQAEMGQVTRVGMEGLGCGPQGQILVPPATIAAPYCGPSPDELCFVFEWKNLGEDRFDLGMIPRDAACMRSGIQECAALPTGLILYDTRVFKDLPKPWFEYEWADPEQTVKASTEDVVQTRNASILGMPQFVAWDCWAGHIKLKIVGKPIRYTPEIISEKLKKAMAAKAANATVKFMPGEPGPPQTGPTAFKQMNVTVEEFAEEIVTTYTPKPEKCDIPPPDWDCTRGKGHEPPCAAVPKDPRDDPSFKAQVVDDPLVVSRADRYPAKKASRYGVK